jgi:hypothetical protein
MPRVKTPFWVFCEEAISLELFNKLKQRLEVTLANQQSKGNMGVKAANLFIRVGKCEACGEPLLRHPTKTKVRRRQWMQTDLREEPFATMEEIADYLSITVKMAYHRRDKHKFQWEYIDPPQRQKIGAGEGPLRGWISFIRGVVAARAPVAL